MICDILKFWIVSVQLLVHQWLCLVPSGKDLWDSFSFLLEGPKTGRIVLYCIVDVTIFLLYISAALLESLISEGCNALESCNVGTRYL